VEGGAGPARTGAPIRRGGRGRPPVVVVIAAWLIAIAATLTPSSAQIARAATDGLELTTAATYTIVPARHAVGVAIDVTARNNKPNVTSGGLVTKYFYEGSRLAIQTEATNVKATSGGVRVTATTKPADGYLLLEVRFRTSLFYHQTTTVHVTFDLPGGAPRSKSDIRVGPAFATFVAWAFGDSGSVKVVVPAGFEAESTGSDAAKTTSGGATIFRATGITDIGSWYLVVNADRKSALTNDRVDLTGGEHIVIRAWPEDAEWRKQVIELLTSGLPELVEQTGLNWPVTDDLSIFEVHTPLLEGYAGVFFQGEDKIEISEDLDDLTIIHEASHAWFNSDLFDGRWINEGLADTYAAKALDGIGKGGWAPNHVSPTDKAAVRLVDWVHPGRITDEATDAREQFGYDASWTVISSLLTEIGSAQMRHVLTAAQDHQIAYVGVGSPETVTGDNDWRRLLDLLDEVGRSHTADDAFRRWVLTDAQAETLDVRAAARTAYAALVRAGVDWQVPFSVRGPMSDWDFATATTRMADASLLLARRDAIASLAAQLGVSVPADLRAAYQTARDSLADANRIADSESAAVRALATATAAVGESRAPLMTLGLLGATPEVDLAAARAAFSAGAADAGARAMAVTALIDGAVGIGRGRLLAAIGALVGLVVLLVIAIFLLRRRGRRHRAMAESAAVGAAAAAELMTIDGSAVRIGEGEPTREAGPTDDAEPAGGVVAEPPYATLADQSSPPLDEAAIETDSAPAAPVKGTAKRPRTRTRSTKPKRPRPNDATEPPPADRGDAP
jgi:hypothetical protein